MDITARDGNNILINVGPGETIIFVFSLAASGTKHIKTVKHHTVTNLITSIKIMASAPEQALCRFLLKHTFARVHEYGGHV